MVLNSVHPRALLVLGRALLVPGESTEFAWISVHSLGLQ
jgi:hypothetical protein